MNALPKDEHLKNSSTPNSVDSSSAPPMSHKPTPPTMLEKALEGTAATSPFREAWKNFPIGYPRLAERIAVKPETGIFRRFDALNARNLLYLQAELCILEKALQEQEERDKKDKKGKRSEFATDFQCLLEAPLNEGRRQLDLIEKMRKKLKQYSELPVTCPFDGGAC